MMKKTKQIFFILVYTTLICLFFISCTKNKYLHLSLEEMKIKPYLKQLVREKKEYFKTSYTLAVMLDSQACGANLVESVWWKDWQKFMFDNKLGFVFVTNKSDSLDLAIASKLDSVEAPILILPGNHEFISNLWKPGQSIPLKILINSTGSINTAWLSIRSEEESLKLIQKIDSLINQ